MHVEKLADKLPICIYGDHILRKIILYLKCIYVYGELFNLTPKKLHKYICWEKLAKL